jgi:hypothetical protein
MRNLFLKLLFFTILFCSFAITTSYEHPGNLMVKVIPTILSCQMRAKVMCKESVNNVVVVVVVVVVVGGGGGEGGVVHEWI